jgi:hypothetical protein
MDPAVDRIAGTILSRLLLLTLLAAGCSYTFDEEAPDIPLVGAPSTAVTTLNRTPAGPSSLIYGADRAWWAAFTQIIDTPQGKANGIHYVSLSDPSDAHDLVADDVEISWRSFYVLRKDKLHMTTTLTIVRPGDGGQAPQFSGADLPYGPSFVVFSYYDDAFFYWVVDPKTTTFRVWRGDHSFYRDVPVPDGVDPTDPLTEGQLFFDLDGNWLFTRDANGRAAAHSTTSGTSMDLGLRPTSLTFDDVQQTLIACGSDGLRALHAGDWSEQLLDATPCDEHADVTLHKADLYYSVGSELRAIARDGSGAPRRVLESGLRVLAFGPNDEILYSRDPIDRYVGSAGDGWLGSWRFMERGRDAYLFQSGRVRWLEHAARPNGSGDLISSTVGGAPLHLTRNTRQYEELEDGRVLCDANHAFRGTQNRAVVVDEQARVAHWVAAAASDFIRIPGTQDILVDVVSGPSTYDIVRVPIPPK